MTDLGPFIFPAFWIILGLGLLIGGGELLVRGASALAAAVRISPLIIGLTVVAFGTSAPELAVSVQSALAGKTDLAIGNVVGSNITNVLLILGLAALVAPLVVSSQLVRFDVPLMIAASMLLLVLGWDRQISRLDGCVMFGLLLVYIGRSIHQGRKEDKAVAGKDSGNARSAKPAAAGILLQLVWIVLGLLLLGLGSHWLVNGCVEIATLLDVPELIIGLTIVAVGTSLPEVVTSVTASIHNQRDIAVGNVVGSNLFNILCVLGLSGIVAPDGIAVPVDALRLDIPIMIAVAVACLPVFFTEHLIARWEGGMFLGYYTAYVAFLVLAALDSPLAHSVAFITIVFLVPLTAVTVSIGVVRYARQMRQAVE